MKRLVASVLVLLMIFSVAGCEIFEPMEEKQAQTSIVPASTVEAAPQKAEVEPAPAAAPAQPEESTERYIGNKNTHKFHRESCGYLPYEKNRVYFDSRDEVYSYYKPCKNCNP